MMRRLTSVLARRRVVVVGIAGLLIGAAAFGSPALAYFSGTTSSQTLSIATGSYSCFTRTPADSPYLYYAYDESSGTSLTDSGSGGRTGTITSGTRTTGSCAGGNSPALSLASTDGGAVSPQVSTEPTTMTLETWFNTTTTQGGTLLGYNNVATGTGGSNPDLNLYMTNSGTLDWSTWNGSVNGGTGYHTLSSSSAYNDGAWHLVDATVSSSAGMTLSVDGVQVASNSSWTSTRVVGSGYWRIGQNRLNSWPDTPNNETLVGSLDDTAVYTSALSPAQITAHLGASEVAPCVTRTPVDNPSFYYSYNQVAGSSITDSGANGNTGTIASGTVAATACTNGASPVLSIAASDRGASSPVVNTVPSSYTEETWFKTTTTTGGDLIDFGNAATGGSTTKDRILYMTNAGNLMMGIYNDSTSSNQTIISPSTYNDGAWHFAVAVLSSTNGMTLYVDGVPVASNSNYTVAQNRTQGYWRVGYDNLNGTTNQPTSYTFVGSLDDTAVYTSALTASQVTAHFALPR